MNRHKLCFIFFFLIIINDSFSQSPYCFLSNKKLELAKVEAVKSGDYAKAAEIKKELDVREGEQKKIETLQADLNNKIKTEDYAGAAKIKAELKELQEKNNKENELRDQIAASLVAEDYEKAAKYKTELLELIEGASSSKQADQPLKYIKPEMQANQRPVENPVPNTNTPAPSNSNIQSQNEKIASGSKTSTPFAYYSIGKYSGFGLGFGAIKQKGLGTYLNFRSSLNLSEHPSNIYEIHGGKINDNTHTWEYTGTGYYSRWEANVGLTSRLFGNINKISGALLYGVGVSRVRYMYNYEPDGNYSDRTLILDNDLSGYNFNIDWAFLVNFNLGKNWEFNLQLGSVICVPRIGQESMWTIGLGL